MSYGRRTLDSDLDKMQLKEKHEQETGKRDFKIKKKRKSNHPWNVQI